MIFSRSIFKTLLLPGIFVAASTQEMICRLLWVRIGRVEYFNYDGEYDYLVWFETPKRYLPLALIIYGPFFLCAVIGLGLFVPGVYSVLTLQGGNGLDYVMLVLGASILYQAAPPPDYPRCAHNAWKKLPTFWRIFYFPTFLLSMIFRFPLIRVIIVGALVYLAVAGLERLLPYLIR